MKLVTFKGGVHPADGKSLTKDCAAVELLPKGDLVFPLSQHIGAPAKAVVKKKDTVLVGQVIAEAGGFVSSPIISSVSGTVKAIEPRMTVSGRKVDSIVIENDGQYTPIEGLGTKRDYTKMSKAEIIGAVRDAGIVGLGGAGFPTHVKLSPKDPNAIDHIIVNGAECEPYLTSDYRMMLEMGEKLVGGLKVMLSLFDNAKGVIAIEDNKPEAIQKLTALVQGEDNITVLPMKTKYPQGSERNIIYSVTGRQINSKLLPADAGCIVDNVATVVAIYDAVCLSTPLMEKIFTVTGEGIVNPGNYKVRIGTSFADIAEAAGGLKAETEKLISGGPMMGMAIHTLDVPVQKATSALTCFTTDEVAANEPTACICCGRCIDACPSHLIPKLMMDAAERYDKDMFVHLNGMECYECGSCTYGCPAKRPMTQRFKMMRQAVIADRKKNK